MIAQHGLLHCRLRLGGEVVNVWIGGVGEISLNSENLSRDKKEI